MNVKDQRKEQKMRRQPAVDMTGMVYGKVPPNAIEVEAVLLGALMLEKHAFDLVYDLLKPEAFYREAHKQIYEAMIDLNQANQPIDIKTVVERLKIAGNLEMVGGPYYVTQLTNAVVSAANVETHAKIIKQKYLGRELIRLAGETLANAYEDSTDIFDLLEDHERQFTELTTGGIGKTYATMDVALMESLQRIEMLRQKNDHMTGIPTGLEELDNVGHGWQSSDLIILAARPGVGKTAFALQLARHAAMNRFKSVPVAFFSLEMSRIQITDRMLSAESEICLDNIRNGKLGDDQMKHLYATAVQRLASAPIFIDDTAALTIFELRARARRLKRLWKRELGIDDGLIIVDYLQLMSGGSKKGNREQEISEISRGLKQIAKELSLPIIALSQLSRDPEKRTGDKKMPQLADLRESGAIEQDADMVMFIYRPEYHDQQTNSEGESTRGETHLRIAKHRNGSLETIKLKARLDIQKFFPWEDNYPQLPPKSNWRPVNLPYKDDTNPRDLPF